MSNQSLQFPDESFWGKLKKIAKKAGEKVVYAALVLYYTFQKSETPVWAKTTIIAAIAYFILPVDLIPDFLPVAGYGDDLGTLLFAIRTVAAYIDDEVRNRAKQQLAKWFGGSEPAL